MSLMVLGMSGTTHKLCGSKGKTVIGGSGDVAPMKKQRRLPADKKPWVVSKVASEVRVIKKSDLNRSKGRTSSALFKNLFMQPSSNVVAVEKAIKRIKRFSAVNKSSIPDEAVVDYSIPFATSVRSILDTRKVAVKSALVLAEIKKRREELSKLESKMMTQYLRSNPGVKKCFAFSEVPVEEELPKSMSWGRTYDVDGNECDISKPSLADFVVVSSKKRKTKRGKANLPPVDCVESKGQVECEDENLIKARDALLAFVDDDANFAQMEFNIGSDTRQLLRELIDGVGKQPVQIKHVVDFGIPDVSGFLSECMKFVAQYPVCTGIVSFAFGLLMMPFSPALKNVYAALSVALSAVSIYLLSPWVREWVDWLLIEANKYLTSVGQMEGGTARTYDFSYWYDIVSTFVTGAVLAMVTGKSISKSDASGFMRAMTSAANFKATFSDGLKYITEVFTNCINWVLGKLDIGEEWKIKFPSSRDKYPEYYNLYDSVNAFISEMRERPDFTVSKAQRARGLMVELEIFLRDMDRSKEFATYRADIVSLKQNLSGIVKLFDGAGMAAGLRYKPIWLHLMGWTGVGKTSILRRIATDVYAHVATKEEWEEYKKNTNSLIYPYAFENNFYDNYMGQWATVIDELGLVVEVAGCNDDGWMSLIRMINIFCMPLDMAELERKGKTNFTSRVVLSTSNRQHISELKNIYFPEAIRSRCNFPIYCVTKEQYAKRDSSGKLPEDRDKWQVDFSKVPVNGARTKIPCNFKFRNLETGEDMSEEFSYDELIRRLVTEYRKVEQYSSSMINAAVNDIKFLDGHRDKILLGGFVSEHDEEAATVNERIASMMDSIKKPTLSRQSNSDLSPSESLSAVLSEVVEHDKDDSSQAELFLEEDFEDALSELGLPPTDTSVHEAQMLRWFTDPFNLKDRFKAQVETVISDKLRDAANGLDPRIPRPIMKEDELRCVAFAREYCVDTWMTYIRERCKTKEIRCDSQSILDAITDFESVYMKEFLNAANAANETFIDRFLDNKWIKALQRTVTFIIPFASLASITALVFWPKQKSAEEAIADTIAPLEYDSVIPDSLSYPAQSGQVKTRVFRRQFRTVENAQYEVSGAAEDIMLKVLSKNTLTLYIKDSVSTRRAHILMVKGTVGISPRHYWTTPEDDATVSLYFLDNPKPIKTVTVNQFLANHLVNPPNERGELEDFLAFKLDFLTDFGNILPHFVKEGSACLSGAMVEGFHLTWRVKNDLRVYRLNPSELTFFRDSVTITDTDRFTTRMTLKTKNATFNGACGTPYFTDKGKIIGMHIGGSDRGVAILLTYGMMKDICDKLCKPSPPVAEPVPPPVPKDVVSSSGHMEVGLQHEVVGYLPYVHSRPVNNIQKSKYHHAFPEVKVPAKVNVQIKDGEVYDPLKTARHKVMKTEVAIPPLLHAVASDYVITNTLKQLKMPPMGKRMATFQEAVCGIEGQIPGMVLKTSPGWPLNTMHKPGGKAFWVGGEDGYDLTKQEALALEAQSDAAMAKLFAGERPLHVFGDNVKVELRTKGKEWTPRQINAYAFLGSVNVRRLCLAFIIAFCEARHAVGSALGMDVHGTEWDDLALHLKMFAALLDGDYSSFDATYPRENHLSLIKLINRFYAGEDEVITRARTILLMDLYDSYHVVTIASEHPPGKLDLVDGEIQETIMTELQCSIETVEMLVEGKICQTGLLDDKVVYFYTVLYKWKGGMPSGHPFTTIGNIHGNSINLRCAAIQCKLKTDWDITEKDIPIARLVMENMYTECYGDDNIVALHKCLVEDVNFQTLSAKLAGFGMKYTPPEKDGSTYLHKTLEEISFLSRSFEYNKILGRYVAKLKLDSIDNMFLWKKKGEDASIMRDRINGAFKEYTYHGEELYNERVKHLLPILDPKDLPDTLDYMVQLQEAINTPTYYF